ncbi:MAG: hypothetical protein ACYC6G_07780 [Desulfobaccales bacterium]
MAESPFTKGKSALRPIERNYGHQVLTCLLITSIVLITVIKLSLMGTGFLAFPDEMRYCQSGRALQHLSELKIDAAMKDIFTTQGRPADAIIKVIPNAMQYVTAYIFKLNYYESRNSYPLFIFNFIIYCLILVVHYNLSKLLLKENFLALFSVLLFSTLTNSYLYLRHALPYDVSFIILYWLIYKIALYTEENSVSSKKSLVIGFCAFLGYLVYPGYFPLFIVGLFILFFNKLSSKNIYKKLIYSGYYTLGGVLCLVLFEKIARLVGRSYILDAIGLSKTITQGSFEESFVFILKYLFEVEGVTGIILLIGWFVFLLLMLYKIKNKTFKQYSLINLLGLALISMYLAYASSGYFFHKMVFYGRLIHQYLPFVCIFAIFSLNEIISKITHKNKLILYLISIIFVINYGFNFMKYNSCAYPRDILWQLARVNNSNIAENIFAYDDRWPVMPKGSELNYSDINGKPISSYYNIIETGDHFNGSIYLLNGSTTAHIFNPKDNYSLLESKPSFMNFKAYQYDSGATMHERDYSNKVKIKIDIFTATHESSALNALTR